jgi:hypothetical protein
MSEWISVKDRLPARDGYCLWALGPGEVRYNFGAVVEGYFDPWPSGMQFWRMTRCPSVPRSLREVTHWMPLPDPPQEKADR